MAEQEITIVGLKKEQARLRVTFDKARASFDKSKAEYTKAKDAIVKFSNSYGRVLELLVPPKSVKKA